MKPVLICYPPFEGKNYLKKRAPFPIGPLYLSAYLTYHDVPSFVKDFSYPPTKGSTKRPKQLQTGQSSYFRWGYNYQSLKKWLIINLPKYHKIVGVSSLMSSNWTGCYALINAIKKVDPYRTIVIGGPHATAFPEHVFKHSQADYICIGEGEEAFFYFITGCKHEAIISRNDELPNVLQRRDFIKNMDLLPFPKRELLLDNRETKELYVTFSRACPHRCSFCGSHIIQGRWWRSKSIDRVISEIKFYYSEWGVRRFVIEDDNPCPKGVGQIYFKRILQKIIELQKEGYKMQFNVSHGFPVYATANKEFTELLHEANFKGITFPVESTNPKVLKHMNKGNTPKYWREGLKNWTYEKHPPVPIILGYPFVETIKTMLQTMIDIADAGCLIWASHFRLNKGTPLYKQCLNAGYVDRNYDPINTQGFFIETERFNKNDLQELMQISRGINFGIESGFNPLREIPKSGIFNDIRLILQDGQWVSKQEFKFHRSQNITASLILVRNINYRGRPFITFKDNMLLFKGVKESRVYHTLGKLIRGRT